MIMKESSWRSRSNNSKMMFFQALKRSQAPEIYDTIRIEEPLVFLGKFYRILTISHSNSTVLKLAHYTISYLSFGLLMMHHLFLSNSNFWVILVHFLKNL